MHEFQTIQYRFLWRVDKWDQDAIEWVAQRLGKPVTEVGSLDMERFHVEPYASPEFTGNKLLDEGVNVILHRLIGDTSSPYTAYNNATAQIGVGDSTTAESRSQTGLLGTSAYAGMVATYPQIAAGSTVTSCTWRGDFASGTAEWGGGWQEWTIRNGATDDRNLNRRVEVLGTGKSSELWTAEGTITIQG